MRMSIPLPQSIFRNNVKGEIFPSEILPLHMGAQYNRSRPNYH